VRFYGPDIGLPAVFLAAGDYHHHIALNTFATTVRSTSGTTPTATRS
jgi:catechol-2,3-dioxygenase